jgi:hypothetical protein
VDDDPRTCKQALTLPRIVPHVSNMHIRNLDHLHTHDRCRNKWYSRIACAKVVESSTRLPSGKSQMERVSHPPGKVRTDPVNKSRSTFSGPIRLAFCFWSDAVFFLVSKTHNTMLFFGNVDSSCLVGNADNSTSSRTRHNHINAMQQMLSMRQI